MKQFKYLGAAFTAYFLWGFFSFGLRPLADYAPTDILYYRMLFSFIVLLIIMLGFRKKALKADIEQIKALTPKQRKPQVRLYILGALLLITNWVAFIVVMNHVSIKAASLAYLICPILTTVLSFFILKDKLTKEKWIAVGISTISCIILAYGHAYDLMFSLIVALSYAIYLIIQKKFHYLDSLNNITFQLGIMLTIMTPYFLLTKAALPSESIFYICISTIVVLFTIIPLFLSNFALKGINSSSVGIFLYINPLINFFLALFYFKEAITVTQIVAYSMIIVSIIVFNSRILFSKSFKPIAAT